MKKWTGAIARNCSRLELRQCFTIILLFILVACDLSPINDPHPKEDGDANTFFASFAAIPKTLDPARSYFADEYQFLAQTYEPPLQYHYLKRPYQLIPLTATQLPEVHYYNDADEAIKQADDTDEVSYTLYTIEIKPGIYFQPHPAFAKDSQGQYLYLDLAKAGFNFNDVNTLNDFKFQGTRELTAQDYVYQIKRLADPKIQSPIFGLMRQYIMGLDDYSEMLSSIYQHNGQRYIDHRQYPLAGAQVIDRYHYQIKIKGKYPQFIYWLAMSFFAPMPWEADRFYAQAGMADKNLTLDWYPVGTGAYMLTENNPNYQIVLNRNPNFHQEYYPSAGTATDKVNGLLKLAGRKLPFIDRVVFSLEKETIPRWNKFLQGYYDNSTISSDSFDEAIRIDADGKAQLTAQMRQHQIQLQTSIEPAIYYIGFNMLDDTVGGYSEAARKLRQAISIAINFEEYIDIFLNGRGKIAQGPIPPEILGYQSGENGLNTYVYNWCDQRAQRKSLQIARKLLAQAGYPKGLDKDGHPLVLNYDTSSSGGSDEKARFDWLRKQFKSLGIQLNIRASHYNRFQEKIRKGSAQIFSWSWYGDYPDPENYLFIFLSHNGAVLYDGPNRVNYSNENFDHLFNQMKAIDDDKSRSVLIAQMVEILRRDAPWVWGYYPEKLNLFHDWLAPYKTIFFNDNSLKYKKLDPKLRVYSQYLWNKPIIWPIMIFLSMLLLVIILFIIKHWIKIHKPLGHNNKRC